MAQEHKLGDQTKFITYKAYTGLEGMQNNSINLKHRRWECRSCSATLENEAELKEHYKSEWHRLNLRRKVQGFRNPIPQIVFQEKIDLFHLERLNSCKGTSHLKRKTIRCRSDTGKQDKATLDGEKSAVCANFDIDATLTANMEIKEAKKMDEINTSGAFIMGQGIWYCPFDRKTFTSVDATFTHMQTMHCFFIKDREYLINAEGLLCYLGKKVYRLHKCIYCNKGFSSIWAVQKHMNDKGHTFIGPHLNCHRFYDYSKTYLELLDKAGERKKHEILELLRRRQSRKKRTQTLKEIKLLRLQNMQAASSHTNSSLVSHADEWEDLDKDEHMLQMERNEHAKITKDEASLILNYLGFKRARITDCGFLKLFDGREIVNRRMAYLYNQRRRRYRHMECNIRERIPKISSQKLIKNSREDRFTNFPEHQLRLGMKANKLQRYLKRQTKYFV